MNFLNDLLILAGRILIGICYLWVAFETLRHWKRSISMMEERKVPNPSLVLPAEVLMQLLGGLSLVLGFYTRIGSIILIAFTLPAMAFYHGFWGMEGEDEKRASKALFMKDAAIIGGLLFLLALGAGRFAVN